MSYVGSISPKSITTRYDLSAITFLYCSNASDYRYSVAHKQPLGYYYRYTNTQCM
jgi:hypothetical protein